MFRMFSFYQNSHRNNPFSSLVDGTIRTFVSLAITLAGLAIFFWLLPFVLVFIVVGLLSFGAIISLAIAIGIYRRSRNFGNMGPDIMDDNDKSNQGRCHIDVEVIDSSDS